jgi:hypothetical protein
MSIPASSIKESVASFDHGAGVMDSDFSVTTRIKSNFTCFLGHGSNENRFPPNLDRRSRKQDALPEGGDNVT